MTEASEATDERAITAGNEPGAEVEPGTEAEPDLGIGWILPLLTVAWLVTKAWAAHEQIRTSGGGTIALATAAAALPGILQAVIVAGIGVGLGVIGLWTSAGARRRWVAGIGGGLLIGVASAATIMVAYPKLPSVAGIAVAVAAGGVIGGLIAAAFPDPAIPGAAASATLASFVAITILNSNAVLSRMLRAYGGKGSDAAGYLHANNMIRYTDFAIVGIVAGLTAFWYLRRRGIAKFPLYMLGGASAGLLLLIADGLMVTGGAKLLDATKAISEADRLVNDWESSWTVPNALLAVFVGAFVAVIAFGRTLKPKVAVAPAPVPAPVAETADPDAD